MIKMKIMGMCTVVLLFTGCALFAGGIMSEQSVVDRALAGNPALISAQKMAGAAEARSHKSFFLENPMAGIDYKGVQNNTLNLENTTEKMVMVSQVVPFPLKYIWKVGGALADADFYKYMYRSKKLDTIRDAHAAFLELYKIEKFIAITRESSGILKQLSNVAFTRYNQGMTSQQDVFKSDLELASLENELLSLNRQRETAIQKIARVTGDSGAVTTDAFTLADPEIPELKKDFETIKAEVMKSAPMIKAAAAGKSSAENMRNMAIIDYFPDIEFKYKKVIDPGSTDYEIMAEAQIPIWFMNNQQADIGEKWNMAESKAKDLEDVENSTILEAKDHFETIKTNYITLDLYKSRLIPQADAAVKSMLSSYQSKKIEFMALLDSERMLLEMKKDYYMKLEEYLMHYRMLEAMTEEQ
jgi:outer membrane protein TolC